MKIVVIGETCKDVFVYGDSNRLSPEAPVPVFTPVEITKNPGMSGNVIENLKSMNKSADVVGRNQTEIITKTRYVDKKTNHMFIRVDENDTAERIFLNNSTTNLIRNSDIVVVSDYDKGFLTEDDIHQISKKHPLTFIDTKKPINLQTFSDYTYIKMNEWEWELCERKGAKYEDWADKLIITMSERGCLYQNEVYPVNRDIEVRDLSGAGDTFMASLVFKYVETKNLKESIKFANDCATKVVQKRGVTTI